MINVINNTIKKFGIKDFGICDFDKIKHNLINCRAMSKIPSGSKSVIVFLFPYKGFNDKGNISRYCAVRDYHTFGLEILDNISKELKSRFKGYEFIPFIDSSPIPEVQAAINAGLGVRGDNSLLISHKYGTWVFIGEIVTNIYIPSRNDIKTKECMHCGLCSKKCPGNAICEGKINKEYCISYITQKKGILNETEKRILKLSDSIWGCDLCQEICPMNKNKESTYIKYFKEDVHLWLSPNDYDTLKNRAYQWRPKSVLERNAEIIK